MCKIVRCGKSDTRGTYDKRREDEINRRQIFRRQEKHAMTTSARHAWQIWRDRRGRLSILRIVTLALLLAPLVKALLDAGAIAHSARPINDLIHRAGFWALVFL